MVCLRNIHKLNCLHMISCLSFRSRDVGGFYLNNHIVQKKFTVLGGAITINRSKNNILSSNRYRQINLIMFPVGAA